MLGEKAAAGAIITVERTGAEAGADAVIETTTGELVPIAATTPGPAPAEAGQDGAAAAFPEQLLLCPGMSVSNAPAADATRRVIDYRKTVEVRGVKLASFPATA